MDRDDKLISLAVMAALIVAGVLSTLAIHSCAGMDELEQGCTQYLRNE